MMKVLFICHGNICRSTMAQFVFQDIVNKEGYGNMFHIDSAATSREEIGNDIHYGTKAKLKEMNIPFTRHAARQMTKKDYETYDYLIGMDDANLRHMKQICGNDPQKKLYKLLDFADGGAIADPWYTGNFDATYRDVSKGCHAFMTYLKERIGEENEK